MEKGDEEPQFTDESGDQEAEGSEQRDSVTHLALCSLSGVVTLGLIHRMNNLLTSLMGWVDLIASDVELPTEKTKNLSKVKRMAEDLREMIADFLILSSLPSSSFPLSRPVNLWEIWDQCERLVRPLLRKKQVTLNPVKTEREVILLSSPQIVFQTVMTALMIAAGTEESEERGRSFQVLCSLQDEAVQFEMIGPFERELSDPLPLQDTNVPRPTVLWLHALRQWLAPIGGDLAVVISPPHSRLTIRWAVRPPLRPKQTL
ncbi:MAG: hypothetical protein NZ959_06045 [Armatimonadetes bacterium]|nr:hypothetical protein [Armatimonadota bacterium]MDW8121230.1 hypothetical protein [Armatimonadota bacterium]